MKAGFKNILIASVLISFCSAGTVFCFDNYEAGKLAYKKGNYTGANIYFKKALADNPNNIYYRYYYAQTLVYLLKLDDAQREYEIVIEKAPLSDAAKLSSAGIANIQKYLINQNDDYSDSSESSFNKKNKLRAELMQGIGDNFINNAADKGMVMHWVTQKSPLKIYFNLSDKIPGIQPYYVAAIKSAFDSWIKNLDGKLSYEITNIPQKANIIILFVPEISDQSREGHSGYISGLATPHTSGKELNYVDIKFKTLKPGSKPFSEDEIYNTALHEIGHSLGIMGHSSNENDVMFPVSDNSRSGRLSLSPKDISTVKLLYRLDADISNFDTIPVSDKESEKNSLILGDSNSRLDTKLQEAKDYVKRVPYHPISWTNLGNAYSSKKQYYDAISSFKKALSLDKNYIQARESLANTYKDMNDVVNATIEYQQLISTNPKNIAYSYNLALLMFKNQKAQDAKTILNNLIINNPKAKEDENVANLLNQL